METKQSISSFIRSAISNYDIYDGIYTLKKLQELAKTVVPRTCHGNWNYETKRKRFQSHRFMKRKKGKQCFVCELEELLHRHHIIPLSNGGVSIKENVIGVCESCHSKIHGFKVGKEYKPVVENGSFPATFKRGTR